MNNQAGHFEKELPQVAVITGDIVNSQQSEQSLEWLSVLKDYLSRYGGSPKDWQVYRGDSFQLIVYQPEDAFRVALHLKAVIKRLKDLDVRMAIGVGTLEHHADQVLQSNGEAFVYSGRKFDSLKKQTLAVKTPWQDVDKAINLLIKLALLTIDDWPETSADVVAASLEHPQATQKEIAALLSIPQSRVSERLSRAGFDAIKDVERYYREAILKRL
ncbi:SatD family protein [Kangiella taiwanensis]|uniref:Transcriptional regulator n=1 Tax=Kangiella taiwanensis TaxID=1079179 RepID=A0ABP8HQN7_9GAMM|nr:SatD family protein [Kangiella taiwanensis]